MAPQWCLAMPQICRPKMGRFVLKHVVKGASHPCCAGMRVEIAIKHVLAHTDGVLTIVVLFLSFFTKNGKIQPRGVEKLAAWCVEQPRCEILERFVRYLYVQQCGQNTYHLALYLSISHEYVIQPRTSIQSATKSKGIQTHTC